MLFCDCTVNCQQGERGRACNTTHCRRCKGQNPGSEYPRWQAAEEEQQWAWWAAEPVDRQGKQADAKSGTPTEVWDALNPSCHSCQLVNLCPGHIMQICMWYLYQVMRCTILDKRWCAFLWAAAFACVFIAATLRVTRYENKSSLGKLHLVSDNFAHCCWQKGNIGIQVFGVSVRSKVSKDKATGD